MTAWRELFAMLGFYPTRLWQISTRLVVLYNNVLTLHTFCATGYVRIEDIFRIIKDAGGTPSLPADASEEQYQALFAALLHSDDLLCRPIKRGFEITKGDDYAPRFRRREPKPTKL